MILALIDPSIGIIVGSAIAALGAGIPASMAWRSSSKGATQESVDTLHDCLNKHTIQDDQNFKELRLEIKSQGEATRYNTNVRSGEITDAAHSDAVEAQGTEVPS